MNGIRYTLLSDGSSDQALMSIITWPLRQHCHNMAIQPSWADLRRIFDEPTIRRAAGNPNGRQTLELPRLSQVEELLDPKQTLYKLLSDASGLRVTRLKQFQADQAALRLADLIEDYGPLRSLSAFRAFEIEVKQIVTDRGWSGIT